jgi:thioredoxin
MSQDDELDKINRKKLEELIQRKSQLEARTASTSHSAPLALTDSTFNIEVSKHPLMVVDFWAPWCGPCRMVAPSLERIAAEMGGQLRIAKLNVDENPRTAERFQVQGIPTIMFVKNGRVVDRVVGALPEPQIRSKVERLLRS